MERLLSLCGDVSDKVDLFDKLVTIKPQKAPDFSRGDEWENNQLY